MLISPPFLPPRQGNETEDAWLDRCMGGYQAGQGAFPIGNNMAWHGGLHLSAPALGAGFEPVRAIADGVLLYKQPSTATSIPELKNSSNRVDSDNGVVILKHTTDIGTKIDDSHDATNITFYSLYMHMDTLADKLPNVGNMVYRKDVLGIAGTVDSRPRTIHFEIVCDEANLKKLLNLDEKLAPQLSGNGRIDAVYGENHYLLPAHTAVYASKPPLHQPVPSGISPKTYTAAGESLIVSQFYACGPGYAHPNPTQPGTLAKAGSTYYTTRKQDGTVLGTTVAEDAEYNLYQAATDISHAYEALHLPAAAIPAPSAVYELLRFGRVINTEHETPLPANVPNWQQIHHGSGASDLGWVNLNTTGTRVYSDADFPGWQGWQLIQDGNTDGRCQSTTLQNLLKTTPGQTLTWELAREHYNTLLDNSQPASLKSRQLRRAICKMNSEWDRSKVDQNTKWRQERSDYNQKPLSAADLEQCQNRVRALCFNYAEYFTAQWHFNPREFIGHFRKCGWLSAKEFQQIYPNNYTQLDDKGVFSTAKNALSENTRSKYLPFINMVMRKINVSPSPARMACYLGQAAEESRTLTWMTERRSEEECNKQYSNRNGNDLPGDGYLFRGRGIKQMTGKSNYFEYWVYRKWLSRSSATPSWWNSKAKTIKRPVIGNVEIVINESYVSVDTGAWFWVAEPVRGLPHPNSSINRIIKNKPPDDPTIRTITRAINGAETHLKNRIYHTKRIYPILGDFT